MWVTRTTAASGTPHFLLLPRASLNCRPDGIPYLVVSAATWMALLGSRSSSSRRSASTCWYPGACSINGHLFQLTRFPRRLTHVTTHVSVWAFPFQQPDQAQDLPALRFTKSRELVSSISHMARPRTHQLTLMAPYPPRRWHHVHPPTLHILFCRPARCL
jgi:hypothetical protein